MLGEAGPLAGTVRVPTTWSFHFQLRVQVWQEGGGVSDFSFTTLRENVSQANTGVLCFSVIPEMYLKHAQLSKGNKGRK